MADRHEDVKKRMDALYNMLVEHDGYGEMRLDFKILKKGQKEIIIHCGFDDAELQAITSSVKIRDSDRRVFTDPEVREAIEAAGIELSTWKEFHQRQKAAIAASKKASGQ